MKTSRADTDERPDEADDGERLRRELEDEQKSHLRLLADFDNYRRRVARELESAGLGGRREALLPLLPVLDTLERALAAGSSDANFLEGVAATQRQFLKALQDAGAEPIASIGRPFDPGIHEVVATVPADGGIAPGTVSQEVRRGWRLKGDLLRPAQVVVTAAADQEQDDRWP